jgi:hypothetical protein
MSSQVEYLSFEELLFFVADGFTFARVTGSRVEYLTVVGTPSTTNEKICLQAYTDSGIMTTLEWLKPSFTDKIYIPAF